MQELIIVIPIEVKRRELLNRLFLTYELLANKNIKIILSKSRMFLHETKKIKNVIYLEKSLSTHKSSLTKKILKDNFISVIDEEGPINNWPDLFKNIRLPKDIFINKNMLNYYIRNNSEFHILKKKNIKKIDKVKLYGHPKFDVLKKPFINLFNKEVAYIKKRYKNFYLINSSFMKDSIIDFKLYKLFLKKNYSKNKKQSALLKKYENQIYNDNFNYKNIINLSIRLAKKYPKINFVFRCHPRQKLEFVKKRFPSNLNNLIINNEFSVTPWLIACNGFIHSHCTSVYEAASLKKKIFSLRSNYDTFQDKKINKIGYSFSAIKNFEVFFDKYLKKPRMYDLRKIRLNNYQLINPYKHNFSEKFVNDIKKLRQKKISSDVVFKRIQRSFLKQSFLNVLVFLKKLIYNNKIFYLFNKYFYISDRFLFSSEYKKSKLDSLNKNELLMILKRIKLYHKKKINYKIKKTSENTIMIERDYKKL